MCGFVGVFHSPEKVQISAMNETIHHRGPDDEGYFSDDVISLGFKRLSIIDVEHGHQPFHSACGNFVLVFNGEIYNYLELKEEMIELGVPFDTASDTEVLLQGYLTFGEEIVNKLRGMFAFCLYDKTEQTLFAARDIFGIKPFYYLKNEHSLYFASEAKALHQVVEHKELNQEALQHYFSFQYVPSSLSLIEDIHKLPPGHTMKINAANIEIRPYNTITYTSTDKPEEIRKQDILQIMRDSVQKHMRSDVPVGCFLSGGIDSTAVVALAKEINPDILTFTVGFEREGYSEIDYAKESADALNVVNHHVVVTAQQFKEKLPKILSYFDDPVADPAAIPLYFVAQEARKYVKVVLSGEGADELFGGYRIYNEPNSLKPITSLPSPIKSGLRQFAEWFPEGMKGKNYLMRGTTVLEQRFIGNAKLFNEAEKMKLLNHYDPEWSYTSITSPIYEQYKDYDDITKMMMIDMKTWLEGDILTKADRMTMAHSLELRVPFLDKEVLSVAANIPASERINHGITKYLLREAMKEVIPTEAVNRPKLGFPVPIRHWLKHEWYEWARELFEGEEASRYLNQSVALQLLEEHRHGLYDHSRKIWSILVFILWHQHVFSKTKEAAAV